jgi:hypothetical protein
VAYVAHSPTSCPYRSNKQRCSKKLETWEEYLDHLKKHSEGTIPGGPWELPGRPLFKRPSSKGPGLTTVAAEVTPLA